MTVIYDIKHINTSKVLRLRYIQSCLKITVLRSISIIMEVPNKWQYFRWIGPRTLSKLPYFQISATSFAEISIDVVHGIIFKDQSFYIKLFQNKKFITVRCSSHNLCIVASEHFVTIKLFISYNKNDAAFQHEWY